MKQQRMSTARASRKLLEIEQHLSGKEFMSVMRAKIHAGHLRRFAAEQGNAEMLVEVDALADAIAEQASIALGEPADDGIIARGQQALTNCRAALAA